jgi:hypothetical protein
MLRHRTVPPTGNSLGIRNSDHSLLSDGCDELARAEKKFDPALDLARRSLRGILERRGTIHLLGGNDATTWRDPGLQLSNPVLPSSHRERA